MNINYILYITYIIMISDPCFKESCQTNPISINYLPYYVPEATQHTRVKTTQCTPGELNTWHICSLTTCNQQLQEKQFRFQL